MTNMRAGLGGDEDAAMKTRLKRPRDDQRLLPPNHRLEVDATSPFFSPSSIFKLSDFRL